jgi:hypothetical protein
MPKILEEATLAFDELLRMHQLNHELLNTVIEEMVWIRTYANNHNIPLPEHNKGDSLLEHANCLVNEIINGSSPLLRHCKQKASDKWKHFPESNGEVTEPKSGVTKLQVTNFHMDNKISKVTETSQNPA